MGTLERSSRECPGCGQDLETVTTLFCSCGKLVDREGLKRVRMAGLGLTAPKFDAFWASGDPADLP